MGFPGGASGKEPTYQCRVHAFELLCHAGKEGLHLVMTEASRGFSRAGEPVWDFSRGVTGSSGSLSCGAREVKSPCVNVPSVVVRFYFLDVGN